jgi:mannose/fructose/N-acetylgalactosamine-specific phosphotransferase system component IIC
MTAALRIAGGLLLAMGLAVFLNGGISFAKEAAPAAPDPLEWAAKENESFAIPQWVSLGAMVLGGMVLVVGFRSKD